MALKQDHEKRLIPDDWPAEAPSILIPVVVVLGDAVEVIEPAAGIERGVMVRPEYAATKLVGSRASDHADLTIAT